MRSDKSEMLKATRAEVLEEIEALLQIVGNNDTIDNAEALRETELKITAATDKLAGKLIKTVVTNAVNDDKVIEEGKKLAKGSPVRMKNHGKRDAVIHPYRGDPFTIKTTYYCRAGVLLKKGSKKGGSTLS